MCQCIALLVQSRGRYETWQQGNLADSDPKENWCRNQRILASLWEANISDNLHHVLCTTTHVQWEWNLWRVWAKTAPECTASTSSTNMQGDSYDHCETSLKTEEKMRSAGCVANECEVIGSLETAAFKGFMTSERNKANLQDYLFSSQETVPTPTNLCLSTGLTGERESICTTSEQGSVQIPVSFQPRWA